MKNLHPGLILGVVIAIAGLIAAGIFLFLGVYNGGLFNRSFQNLLESGNLVSFIVVPIILVASIVVVWRVFRFVVPRRIKNGVSAPARVLDARDTGISVNDNPQVALLIEVLPKNGSPFQVEVKTIISRLQFAMLRPGISAKVVYDPQNTARIQLSYLELRPYDDAENRLQELDRLYNERLITSEEYRVKREEIIKEL